MRDLVDRLQQSGIVFKSLKPIDLKALGSRKKIDLYLGVDLAGYYACIIHVVKKSRILQKEARELMAFHHKLEAYNESAINHKFIYLQAPLCSKAKTLFEANGWQVLLVD